jgi:non-ribosomal peptide synthetase component F/SAM-dependent methyltransferase/acyl carrier protein
MQVRRQVRLIMSSAALSADRVRLLSRLLDEKKIAPQAPPIPRRRDGLADIPLSFAQQRIWFVHRLQPASSLYNGAGTARLRGHLDVEVARRCVNETIRRHEILRTTYKLAGGRPVQRVEAPVTVALPVTDLTHLPSSTRSAAARVCQNRLMNQPFDLERDLPLRAELLRLAPQEHRLVLVLHHIAGDGWSLGVFHRELAALYAAYLYGRPSPLPELSLQYGDFALWQREGLSGDANGELDYWRERLEGAALLELPTVRPRQAGGDQDGSAAVFELTPGLVQRLSALGDSERSTLYMVLLAATAVVFSRWSGQQDVVVGTPIANRNRLDLEDLIGCFVNTLPLRLDTSGNPSFRSLLRQAREVCLGAYAHQDTPFERIVESVNPVRGIGGETPLVRHMLGLDNAPRPMISLPDLDVEFDFVRPEKARFDIEWVLNPARGGGLSGRVWFATDLFDQAFMARLLASVRTVLMVVAADPDLLVGRLPILAESERVQLLERFSGAARVEPAATRPPDELAAAADRLAAGLWPQRAHLLGYSRWMRDVIGLRPGEVALYLGPWNLGSQSRAAAQLEPLAAALLGGRVVTPDHARSADGSYLAALVAAEQPSVVTCTPSQLAALLASGRATGLTPRHLLLGGEQPWPALVAECGRVLRETCIWSLYRCGGLPVLAGRLPGDAPGVRLAGRPIAGAVLSVLDSRAELAPIGVTGELCVAGSVAAPGLEPVASPGLPGKTLLRTGERARWLPSGVLEVIGQASGVSATGRPPAAEVREALLSHPIVDRAEVTAGLAAHVSLRREVAAQRDLRTLFEERYARRGAEDDPALNPATWTSPVTGTRLSADDLRDWSEGTVRRALALQPRRMLEIGCRNGLLLLRLAPHCELYVATDLSARALRHIRESKDWVVGRADAIQLLRLAPDDLDALPPDSVDLVLVSSIVQYSPSPAYLEQVITAAARVARPPAAILVSDVRSLPLLPALHVLAACRSAPATPLAELRQLVTDRVDGDDELAIDPAWFAQVAAHLPGITGVTVLARSGRAHELAGYRYDVLLWVGERDAKSVCWADQAAGELTTAQAGNLLGEHSPEPVGIRDVPDEPIRIAARAAQLLAESTAANAGELWDWARAEVTSAITLAGLRSAAARSGYDTVLAGPAASGTPGLLDVVMSQAPAAGEVAWLPRLGPALAGPLGHANDVGYAAHARAAVPLLQGHLRGRLPPAMIPELAVRRTWPVGQSGVLDPDRLPQPRAAVRQTPVQRSPQTDTERAIAKIWADVLGLDQVGVDDDFFALGGHSLMAAEVADRIRSELGLELPLGQLFDEPTVTSVARYLATSASDGAAPPAIGRVDRRGYRVRVTTTTGKD